MTVGITNLDWRPPPRHDLALEVMSVAELRGRGSTAHFKMPQRVAFFMIMAITEGRTEHIIDFTPYEATPGTWLILRPGQMQRFDFLVTVEGARGRVPARPSPAK